MDNVSVYTISRKAISSKKATSMLSKFVKKNKKADNSMLATDDTQNMRVSSYFSKIGDSTQQKQIVTYITALMMIFVVSCA